MTKSAADIVAEMISALAVAEPELDTSIGSVTRKILDVVGEQISPAYAVDYLTSYIYDIDTKTGADLDDFCAMFALYRLAAIRATGSVTFSTSGPSAAADIQIPAGTQVGTGTNPPIVFATVAPAVLIKGTTEVSVPVQAVAPGISGNLPSDSLSVLMTPVGGVTSLVTQSDGTTGGVDAESDAALIARFKRTVFRSLAGTEDMFLGTAIEDTTPDDATDAVAVQANVIGASKHWREQVQVATSGTDLVAYSTIPAGSVKFIYPGSSVFGEDIDNGQILTEGIHYTFDTTTSPPTLKSIGDALTTDVVYDLDFEYVPMASRNEPSQSITNRVDIWVAGEAGQQASETTYYRPQTFSGLTTDPLFVGNFLRLSDAGETQPTTGNAFLQLAWGPIIDFPEALTIGGVTYNRDTDYWVVHDDTGYGYAPSSKFGLEWLASNQPPADAQILLSDQAAYFYNRLPADVEARAEKWKLVTTDVWAHAAKQIRLVLNFAIMYSPSYDRGVVQAGVDAAMGAWMASLAFHSVVQVSDMLAVAHAVDGVDNIRFLNSLETATTDPNDWGIQKVSRDGTYLSHYSSGTTPARATDIVLAENEVPVLYDIRYVTRAQNTWAEPSA